MSFKGTVLFKKKDALLPEAYLKMLLENHKSYASLAAIDGKEFVTDGVRDPDLDTLNAAQEAVKDKEALFCLADCPSNTPDDSVMPYIGFEDESGEPALLVFFDGDFSNYHETKSANAPEYFAFIKYFKPRLDKWGKKGGLENILEELRDEDTQQDIMNSFLGRGNVVFFAITGEVITIQKGNTSYGAFPWGFTTNRLNYNENKPTAVPVIQKKEEKKSLFSLKKNTKETETADDKQEVLPKGNENFSAEPQEAKKKSPISLPGKKNAVADVASDGKAVESKKEETTGNVIITWQPKFTKDTTRREKGEMYTKSPIYDLWKSQHKGPQIKDEGRMLPSGYKNGVALFANVPDMAAATKYLELGCTLKDAPGKVEVKPKEGEYPAKDTSIHNKEIQTSAIPVSDKELSTRVEGTAEIKKWFSEATKNKFVAIGSQEIAVDPKTIQSMENDKQSPFEAAGVDLDFYMRLSDIGLIDLARNFPVFAGRAAFYMIGLGWKAKPKDERPGPQDHVKQAEKGDAPIITKKPAFPKFGKKAAA